MIQQRTRRYFNRCIGACRFQILGPGRALLVVTISLTLATLACNLVGVSPQPTPARVVHYKLLPPVTPTINESISEPISELISEPISEPISATVAVSLEANSVNTPEPAPIATQSGEALLPPTATFTPESVQPVTEPTVVPPTPTLIPTSTPTSEPTTTPTLTPTLIPTPPAEWSFANIRLDTSQYEDDLLFYGNVINNTDSAQMLAFISGIFYDEQDQVIADEQDTYDYWLVDVIPPKGQMPFELTVADVQSVARYDFLVEAEPGGESKSSEFEFLNVQTSTDAGDYCLEGTVKNIGRDINDYATIIAVLYDDQDSVINFSDDEFFESLNNGEEGEFFICVDLLGHQVARYELQAWGE